MQSYIPLINRNLPQAVLKQSLSSSSSQTSTAPSLKRKADLPRPPTISSPNPTPPSLLSRLNLQPTTTSSDRSTKRLKVEPTLLDRLQVPSTSTSPSPSPSLQPPSASDDDRGPGKTTPNGPANRAIRNNQRSSPYASTSDLRIRNASSTSTSSIVEPLKNATLEESNANRGLSVRGKAKQNAGSGPNPSNLNGVDPASAISKSFSIKGAASKGKDADSSAALSRPNSVTQKPSLLERTSLASPSNVESDPPKQSLPPVKRQLSIQERLSAPSLVSRLSFGGGDMNVKGNAGNAGGGGRRRNGKGGGQH